jgi:hypothetical protein
MILRFTLNQFQFPKRRVFYLFRIADDGRNPETQWFWDLHWTSSSFRNFVYSTYLEFRTTDETQKPSDSEIYTEPVPVSETSCILLI